jgi:hypothetical protein
VAFAGRLALPWIACLSVMENVSFCSAAHQYFGRWDITHSLACSIGVRGGKTARSFLTLGNASILSRQWQKAGYFG